ncbi:MAG: DUF89 family protein [Candidatus Thermoplasmatota archaeon]|nr:DUF89 family protein [Candidatus Thermoplasmatota archaeon]
MKIQPECVPCLLKRILFETEMSTTDEQRRTAALRTGCRLLSELYDPGQCSATVATKVHQAIYEILGDRDPYKRLKQRSNAVATALVPKIEQLLQGSSDTLRTAMICAIIGNIMDFGIDGSTSSPENVEHVFDRLYAEGLGHDDYQKVQQLIQHATGVVVFTDNCGEIVFDKILCREIKRYNPNVHLTVVVKGEPVLSDATLDDALQLQLSAVVDQVLTTGCFAVGVNVTKLPRAVVKALDSAQLILCKGMANYESFSESAYRPIAYLLRTKCQVIARSMHLAQNISVIKLYE